MRRGKKTLKISNLTPFLKIFYWSFSKLRRGKHGSERVKFETGCNGFSRHSSLHSDAYSRTFVLTLLPCCLLSGAHKGNETAVTNAEAWLNIKLLGVGRKRERKSIECREWPDLPIIMQSSARNWITFCLCCPVLLKSFNSAIHPVKILHISKSFSIKPGIHQWQYFEKAVSVFLQSRL